MIFSNHKKYIIVSALIAVALLLSCKEDKSTSGKSDVLLEKGKNITSSTFMALSSQLQKAMKEGGVSNAVKYCNVQALPITDSLAAIYDVEIKRTSDRVRNPQNTATAAELGVIKEYQNLLSKGDQLKPQVGKNEKGKTFYAPILTNDLCLKCHGNKNEMASYDAIADLYPEDQATGYNSGELRGIWSVQFRK